MFFQILKPRTDLLHEVWVCFCPPFIHKEKYLLETKFFIGATLEDAVPIIPATGSQNHGRSLHLNWPFIEGAGGEADYHQAVVSRILAFTFHFRPEAWHFSAYSLRLVAHHIEDVHENNLLHNLKIEYLPEHSSEHRSKRPKW